MSRAGRLLLADGHVTQEQLERAAREQSLAGGTIGLHLVRAGVIRETTLTSLFCAHLGLQEVLEEELELVTPETARLLPAEIAIISRVVPLELLGDDWLAVAMADPTDDKAVADVARLTGRRLLLKVAAESDVSLALERLYGTSRPADLPGWSSGRDTRPSSPPGGAVEEDDEGAAFEDERRVTTQRRFRAPVVLEGRYDKIAPDELPEDADAGYIPLTQVKQRPPGERSSHPVITVPAVDISDSNQGPRGHTSPPPPLSHPDEDRRPPLHEEILETLGSVTPLPSSSREGAAPDASAITAAPLTPAPLDPLDEAAHITREELEAAVGRPAPARVPRPPQPKPSPKPEPYAGVPGGESWDLDEDENEDDGRATEVEPSRPRSPSPVPSHEASRKRPADWRDTLIDLPKIDASHWTGEGAMPVSRLVSSLDSAESRDEAIQASLSFMASYCRRSAFFVLKRGVVEGFDALGPNLSLDQVRSIWIPLSSRSTLCEAVASKSIRIGPIGDSRTDAIFCAALGGRRGDSLIIPIKLGKRVVSVLYGDDLREATPTMEDLEQVAAALSETLARLMLRDKHREPR